jgi:hypothetical protein
VSGYDSNGMMQVEKSLERLREIELYLLKAVAKINYT